MFRIYGKIIVRIDKPVLTGDFYGRQVYNGLFIHLKSDYYVPVHVILDDMKVSNYIYELHIKGRLHQIIDKFKEFHKQYYENDFFNTVKVEVVESSNDVLTAFYLKALNLLDFYKPYEKFAKLLNMKINDEKSLNVVLHVLDKMVTEYMHKLIESHYKTSNSAGFHSDVRIKMVQHAVSLLDGNKSKLEDNKYKVISLKGITSQFLNELGKKTISSKPPIYYLYINDEFGIFKVCKVNETAIFWYRPMFSNFVLKIVLNVGSPYTTEVVDFGEYYKKYKPKRARGLVPVFNDYYKDTPVVCYNHESKEFYFLAKTRFDKPVIVKVPVDSIETDNFQSSKLSYNGKSYPIAYTKFERLLIELVDFEFLVSDLVIH